jgi:Ca-activated chloride channel family protein
MRDFEKFLEKRGLWEELEYYKFYRGKVGLNAEEAFVVALFPFDSSKNSIGWREPSGIKVCAEKYLDNKIDGKFASHICDLIFENEKKLNTLQDIISIPFYGKYIEEKRYEESFEFGVNTNPVKRRKGSFFGGLFGKNNIESGICNSVSQPVMKTKSINTFNSVSLDSSLDFCEESDCEFEASVSNSFVPMSNEAVIELRNNLEYSSFETIEEKGFKSVLNNPTSTFRLTNNTAAFGILTNRAKNSYTHNSNVVRIEELLNIFKYNLSKPTKRIFNINTEVCSIDKDNGVVFVGVKSATKDVKNRHFVLLLDTSGSMSGRVIYSTSAIISTVAKMNKGDRLSLVTYSDKDHTIFKNVEIKEDLSELLAYFYQIEINGCTYGSAGIEEAYRIAEEYKVDGENRVILITDGDLNFGITSKGGLKDLIVEKKKSGVLLSVIGTGLFNLQDDKLETLSKNGNGNYCTVDSFEDIKFNILDNFESMYHTIAKDVKVQVEFNPKFVKEYRLIGYENRALSHEDFKDDTVISEPLGSDGQGIAIYHVVWNNEGTSKSDLRYSNIVSNDSEHLCSVSVNYKLPENETSDTLCVELSADKKDNSFENSSENLKLAYWVAIEGMKLRNSKYIDEEDLELSNKAKNGLKDLYIKNEDIIEILLEAIKNINE